MAYSDSTIVSLSLALYAFVPNTDHLSFLNRYCHFRSSFPAPLQHCFEPSISSNNPQHRSSTAQSANSTSKKYYPLSPHTSQILNILCCESFTLSHMHNSLYGLVSLNYTLGVSLSESAPIPAQ